MSSEKQDWLSAASDNQGISAQQLDSLLQDPDLQQQWLRYQMIGSVIRKELPDQIDIQILADRFELVMLNKKKRISCNLKFRYTVLQSLRHPSQID
ncbi:MAG: RseA family anti-sigma factor [Rheinheimera sp.]|nr:RseA family anti-sigma factor [Rheinheimera sp.]